MKLFRIFKVAVCTCGHSWTTSAKSFRCSACERELMKRKNELKFNTPEPSLSEPVIPAGNYSIPVKEDLVKMKLESLVKHKVKVHTYFAIRNPFKR